MAVVEDDDVGDRPLLESRINGVLPVVLCAGHGGDDTLQETRLAERPAGEPGVKTLADVGTAQLLEELERRIATKTGANCSIVIAKFHRRFIDVNRDASMPKEHAVACAEGRRLHEAYHAAVDAAVGRLMTANRFGRVLILDLHGQAAHPSQIFIGTRDGATADLNRLETPGEGLLWHLRRRLASVTAPPRMAAMMAAAGTAAAESIAQAAAQAAAVAAVAPPAPGTATAAVAATAEFPVPETEPSLLLPEPGRPELENYKGGYTVHRHCGVGVDAVQLEIGSDWRRRHGARAEMAEVLADAVHHYLQPLVPLLHDAAALVPPVLAIPAPGDFAGAPGTEEGLRRALHKLGVTTPRDLARTLRRGILEPKLVLAGEAALGQALAAALLALCRRYGVEEEEEEGRRGGEKLVAAAAAAAEAAMANGAGAVGFTGAVVTSDGGGVAGAIGF